MKNVIISSILVTKTYSMRLFFNSRKIINLVNSGGSTKPSSLQDNNVTAFNGTTDINANSLESVKITKFLEYTYKLISPYVKYWFGQLFKAAEAGKTVLVKYRGQYLEGSQIDCQ